MNPNFQIEGVPVINGDTLVFPLRSLEASDFFFYPFGEHSNWDAALTSIPAKKQDWKIRVLKNNPNQYWAVSKTDSLGFIFTNRSEIRKFEILSIRIASPKPKLRHEIKIGMGKRAFFQVLFTEFPRSQFQKCRVFETVTGPLDDMGMPSKESIWHYYEFKGNKISKIFIRTKYSKRE